MRVADNTGAKESFVIRVRWVVQQEDMQTSVMSIVVLLKRQHQVALLKKR